MKNRKPIFSLTRKDFVFETFRCGGNGGQHQNKTESGVRVKHLPSEAVGESREERSQVQNKQIAFKRMADSPKFQFWVKQETARRLGILEDIERKVDAWMAPTNLKIEAKNEQGQWEQVIGDVAFHDSNG